MDKLTAEMMERQKLFARLGVQRIDQVDTTNLEAPLPVIFVILDEFSIMSQSIAESPVYKLRLQNILAKGAALGIKFLFSSQTFTTGVAGLTLTARAQIQQRIAMKGAKEEISETLELSTNLKTEQVRNWMDALPPHYALVKFRISADTLPQVKRYLVMYFKDYAPRDEMIERISASMHRDENYHPEDLQSYVDKHPVLVDGNTFTPFDENTFRLEIEKRKAGSVFGDEIYAAFGVPRLMEQIKVASFTMETRENLFLLARSAEMSCTASILLSAIHSFALQGKKVQVWTYERNNLFRTFHEQIQATPSEVSEGIEAICKKIRSIKDSIIRGESRNELIVMIGMDRICTDFEYISNGSPDTQKQNVSANPVVPSNAIATTDEDKLKKALIEGFIKLWKDIEPQLIKEGKSEEEIAQIKKIKRKEYASEQRSKFAVPAAAPAPAPAPDENKTPPGSNDHAAAYNAKQDLEYIVKQGSRLGHHFMLILNSFADLKTTGLKLEYFRYRLSFQLPVDDSRLLFNSKVGSTLPEHICQFNDALEQYSFRPYLHEGIEWDGWTIKDGKVINPYSDKEQ